MPSGIYKHNSLSKEHKKQISNANKGRKYSDEIKKKISISLKKYYKNGGKHSMTGKKLSEDRKRKIGLSKLGQRHSDKTREKMSKNNGKYWLNKKRSKKTCKKIRETIINNPIKIFKDTSIEKKIEKELKYRNILFEKQKSLCKIAIVDFFIKPNIVIECDGDYWHNFPDHIERDKNKNRILRKNGYKVYRFWGYEINNSSKKCIDSIIGI